MHLKGTGITIAIWVQIRMKITPGDAPVQYLNSANLNDTMAVGGVKPCRFSIENNPAHREGDLKEVSEYVNYSASGSPTYRRDRASSTPRFASKSARSLPGSPA